MKTNRRVLNDAGVTALGLAAVLCMSLVWSDRAAVAQQQQFLVNQGEFHFEGAGFVDNDFMFDGQLAGFDGSRTSGFQVAGGGLPIEETAAAEAFRHFEAKDWFKAISAIEGLGEAGDEQLIADQSGVLRPVSSLRRTLLEALPDEGQQTFRQLNDAAARAKLDEALAVSNADARARALEQVLSRYPLCDAAATTASRLGDLRFEAGRFDEANDLYTFAAEHSGSAPDDPKLMAKRLHTLARSERWRGFDKLAQYARFRHAETKVQIGGRAVAFSELIDQLRVTPQQQADLSGSAGHPLTLPDEKYATYSIKLTDPANRAAFNMNSSSRRRQFSQFTEILHPLVVAGPDRFYALHLDTVSAYDAATGSEAWSQGDMQESAGDLAQNSYYLMMDYQQQMLLHENTLLVTNADVDSPSWSRLRAIDTQTGEIRWRTKGAAVLDRYSVVGQPVVRGNMVYTAAREGAGNKLSLITINLLTGGLAESVELGTMTPDKDWSQPVDVNPRLVFGERYLIVLTNNGGLVAVDPETLKIGWAFSYPMLHSQRSRRRVTTEPIVPGDLRVVDGVIFFKDTRDNQIHAIREHDAVRLWSQSMSSNAALVHADKGLLFTVDSQLIAWDQQTGERVWWSPHAGSDAGTPVFTQDSCLVMGTQRSCRIDLETGKVTAFRDDLAAESQSGRLGGVLRSGPMVGFLSRDQIRVYQINDSEPITTGDLTP